MKTTFLLTIMAILCFSLSAQTKSTEKRHQEIIKKAGVKSKTVIEYPFVEGKINMQDGFKTKEYEYDRNGYTLKVRALHRSEYQKEFDRETSYRYKDDRLIEEIEHSLTDITTVRYIYEANKRTRIASDSIGNEIFSSIAYYDTKGRDSLSIYNNFKTKSNSKRQRTYDSIGLKEEIKTGIYLERKIRTNNDAMRMEFDIYKNDILTEKLTIIYDPNGNLLEYKSIKLDNDSYYYRTVSKYNDKNLCTEESYYDVNGNPESVEIHSYTYW